MLRSRRQRSGVEEELAGLLERESGVASGFSYLISILFDVTWFYKQKYAFWHLGRLGNGKLRMLKYILHAKYSEPLLLQVPFLSHCGSTCSSMSSVWCSYPCRADR